eukprot:gene4154-7464_t
MKVLVGVKRVIDYAVKVRVKPDFSGVVKQNIKHSMNPFDEIAMEEAVKMKEKGLVSEIVSVSIGPKESQDVLKRSFAFGADKAIHVDVGDAEVEPLAVAKILKKVVEKETPNLVLLGKQSIDGDFSQTPQILSSLLNWSQATFASKIEISEDKKTAKVTREIDGGLEIIESSLPSVISADLRLNEPRLPNLKSIMAAKKKKIDSMSLEELNVDIKPRLTIKKVEEPAERKGGVEVANVEELVKKLKEEAKVL